MAAHHLGVCKASARYNQHNTHRGYTDGVSSTVHYLHTFDLCLRMVAYMFCVYTHTHKARSGSAHNNATHAHAHAHTQVRRHKGKLVHLHTHTHTHTSTPTQRHTRTPARTHTHTQVHIHKYPHIHTHKHTKSTKFPTHTHLRHHCSTMYTFVLFAICLQCANQCTHSVISSGASWLSFFCPDTLYMEEWIQMPLLFYSQSTLVLK